MEATPELSAIVLCYRAEDRLRHVIEPLYQDLVDSGVAFELVLVANYYEGDGDRTPRVIERFAGEREHVVPLMRPKGGAMGWDMRSGLAAARGRYMVVIDGDDQNPVEDLFEAFNQMKRRDLDVVKGRRIARFDGYWRNTVSVGYNALFLALFRTRGLWDINAKPKGITRDAYTRMDLSSDDWFVDAEIVLQAFRSGMRIGEIPVVFRQNLERRSFVRPAAVLEFLRNMLGQLRRRAR